MLSGEPSERGIPMADMSDNGNKLPGKMLTVKQVAFILNVHTNTVRRWQKDGLLKAYSIGPQRNIRFREEDIMDFLKRSQS